MNNPKEIASTLLTRRETSMSPIIMPGDIQQQLGSDGYSEAHRLRWVEPDQDTGFVKITNNMTLIDQMTAMRESLIKEDAYDIGDTVVIADKGTVRQGVVSDRKPDGTYAVSFGDDGAQGNNMVWRSDQLKLVNKGPKPGSAPVQPVSARPSAPVSSGSPAPASGAPPGGGGGRSLTPGVGAT